MNNLIKCKRIDCENMFEIGKHIQYYCSKKCMYKNWVESHKDRIKEIHDKWLKNNPDRRKEQMTKYERKIGKIPREEWINNKRENADPRGWRGWKWWQRLSVEVKKRDNYICHICYKGKGEGTRKVAHHKDFNEKNNSLDNLITLCNSCHVKIHRNKGGALLFA